MGRWADQEGGSQRWKGGSPQSLLHEFSPSYHGLRGMGTEMLVLCDNPYAPIMFLTHYTEQVVRPCEHAILCVPGCAWCQNHV